MAKFINESNSKIRECIIEHMPKEAGITRIEYEGPVLAIYVKDVIMLLEQSYIVTDIVNLLHKRIVIRPDPSIRVPETEAEKIIKNLVPSNAEITSLNFDPSLGEVIVEAKKPGLVIGKDGSNLQEIIKTTCWRPKVLRAPPLPSKIILSTRHFLHSESEERSRILREVGERIFRPTISKAENVRITALGAFHEVGRSCIIVEAGESMVMLDCGINPGAQLPEQAYPRLDIDEFDIDKLDAVIVSHAHLDHCGFVPFLYKYGYEGATYCSEPTATLMTLLQLDYLDVATREGKIPIYDQKDVRECVLHTIPLKYGVVTDVAPEIKLTLHNAGHILGSSIVHLHVGEGLHNIVYTGDFKFEKTMLLESAVSVFPRIETLIIESTYGGMEDIMPTRYEAETKLVSTINEKAEKGGKVLIPVPAVGRAQEIMLVLNDYMKNKKLKELPIYIDGMISEATGIHNVYPEYLVENLKEQILHKDVNPFQSEYFTNVNHSEEREEILAGGPSIILATSGMLEGGPAVDYFRRMASDERNAIIFVSYQIEGTLGRRILSGLKEVSLIGADGKMEIIKVNMAIHSVEGFSGHSDRNQILSFVQKISPKPLRIIVNHGERKKCEHTVSIINKSLKIKAIAPENLETLRLK
ncbi:MAG: beta-CASP ribonuclease aCPSF1 [Candidatus Bathyarchaeia archaeon]